MCLHDSVSRCLCLFRYYTGNSLSTFQNSLAIAKTPEITKHIEKLIVPQQIVRVLWFTKLGLVNDKGFINYHAPLAQTGGGS